MPVYIRKNISYTPPSVDKPPPEDEDDYINDPELIRDDLPQPFRMIDKVLSNLIDDTWDLISQREEARLEEARKIQPPEFEYSMCLEGPIPGTPYPEKQTLSYATCMTDSVDGKYIFIGLPCGLVALDAIAQNFLGSWEEEGAEVTYIRSYLLGPEIYLINTIDDMGIGRLFAFANSKMFLLKTLNTNPPDSESKTLVSKLESSAEGEYLGVVMENVAAKEMWLEVHKLPKENWLSEIDTIVQALKKREEKKEKEEQAMSEVDAESVVASELDSQQQQDGLPPQAAPIDTSEYSQSVNTGRSHAKHAESDKTSQKSSQRRVSFAMYDQRPSLSRLQDPSSSGSPDANADPQILNVEYRRDPLAGDYKFSPPQLVMKVKSPPQITGVNVTNFSTTCQKIDGGDVIGSGQNHLFSQAHLDLRQNVFDHLHDNLLKYLPQEEEDIIPQQPYFHFLTAGRMLPQGMEQSSLEGRPTIIAVWWPGSTNLIQYSLIKTSKDIEFKPDLVWPFTCKITATAVSDDTNVIAVGLENGNIVVWDRYMGTQRGVVTISHSPIVHLKFLNPNLYPQEPSGYPPYPTKTGAYLMVMCANSSLFTVNIGAGTNPYPSCITPPVENDDDTVTLIEPLPSNQDLSLTVLRKGKIQIRDTLQGNVLCEMQFPDRLEMASPWEPVIALGDQGRLLFIKGTKKLEEDSMEIDSTTSSLVSGTVFMYQLTAFPPLEPYLKKQRSNVPFTVHTKYEERVNSLLADRTARQAERKARMQERWSLLKEEINSIHKIKEIARNNAEKRQIFTAGSVGQTVL